MDQGPQIQLPNSPSETIVPDTSSSSVPWKSIMVGMVVLGLVGFGGYTLWGFKQASDNYQQNLTKRTSEISAILDGDDEGFSIVGEAQASYENPFEEESDYVNPFEADENPFEQ
jgi:hypothetical protein